MLIKVIINGILAILFALVTFFGLGPVLFADGSTKERISVLSIVIAIYVILIILFVYANRYFKNRLRR